MTSYDDFVLHTDKPKRQAQTVTWSDAGRALGRLFLVTSIFSLVMTIIQHGLLGERLQTYHEVTMASSSGNFFPQLNTLSLSITEALMTSMMYVVIVLIALMVVYSLLHLLMTQVFGGVGTLQGLIVETNKTTLGSYLVFILLMTVATTLFVFIVTESAGQIGLLEASSTSPVNGLAWFMVIVWGILISKTVKQYYRVNI